MARRSNSISIFPTARPSTIALTRRRRRRRRRAPSDRRRHRRDDDQSAGGADHVDPEARRHLAGGRVGDRASDNFFNPSATIAGSAVNNKDAVPAPITGATLLSGAAATDSLATNFAAGDTITVNGTPITFVASGATGNQLNVTDSVQTLLQKIDSITGTTNPSTVSGGAITLHGGDGADLTVTSSNTAAFAALGFGATVTANPAPLRVGGPPFNTATTLVAGTAANTVIWYTGETGS